jgi:DNA-directed RNA polymerase subunit F
MDGEADTPVLISNAEVMELLQENLASRERKESSSGGSYRNKRSNLYHHRDWIEKHVYEYLQPTPCGQIEKSRRQEFQNALRSNKKQATTSSATTTGFDLTEAESLQILNFMPTEPVEIHLMIEELHARMTENQQEGLLEFIASYRIKEDDGTAAAAENGTNIPAVAVKKEEEHANI